jgi:hypothetical protein
MVKSAITALSLGLQRSPVSNMADLKPADTLSEVEVTSVAQIMAAA